MNNFHISQSIWTSSAGVGSQPVFNPREERLRRLGQGSVPNPQGDTPAATSDADWLPSPTSIRGLSRRHSHSSLRSSSPRMAPVSPEDEFAPSSAPTPLGPLHASHCGHPDWMKREFLELLSRSPQAALTHPALCHTPQQADRLQRSFADTRKLLMDRFHQIVCETIYTQFQSSETLRPRMAGAASTEDLLDASLVNQQVAWLEQRSTVDVDALFTFCPPDNPKNQTRLVSRSFLRRLKADLRLACSSGSSSPRAVLPRLESERHTELPSKPNPIQLFDAEFRWLQDSLASRTFVASPDNSPCFKPDLFFPANGGSASNPLVPRWLFVGVFGKYFQLFASSLLQLRVEAARMASLFSPAELEMVFHPVGLHAASIVSNDASAAETPSSIKARWTYAGVLAKEPEKWDFVEGKNFLWNGISSNLEGQAAQMRRWQTLRVAAQCKHAEALAECIAFLTAATIEIDQTVGRSTHYMASRLDLFLLTQKTKIAQS